MNDPQTSTAYDQDVSSVPIPIELTSEQSQAVDTIINFVLGEPNRQQFKLGGYAGTGKTTIIKTVIDRLRSLYKRTDVIAFTGKAVSVLERKRIFASTMHSFLYYTEIVKDVGYVFTKRTSLDSKPHLIIVDEASMVSTELYKDLIAHGVKVLWVGDPGQLEPVGDNPNLMREPDLVLNQIHRQAEKSSILIAAHSVRKGGAIVAPTNATDLVITPKSRINEEHILSSDQSICAKNKTRIEWNRKVRSYLGRLEGTLVVGDKIIILRNSPQMNVFNGLILFVTAINGDNSTYYTIDAKDEVGNVYSALKVWKVAFGKEKLAPTEFPPRGLVVADFAYMITCHKSQGSEWDKVLVWDEYMPPNIWDMKRWRYTAITRAAKQLIYST